VLPIIEPETNDLVGVGDWGQQRDRRPGQVDFRALGVLRDERDRVGLKGAAQGWKPAAQAAADIDDAAIGRNASRSASCPLEADEFHRPCSLTFCNRLH
jgi:hypothetical protein